MGLMTRAQYIESLDDGRQVWVSGRKVAKVAEHPALAPMTEAVAQIYDMQANPDFEDLLTYQRPDGIRGSRFYKIPETPEDLMQRRKMTSAILGHVSPTMDRFGDETVTPLFVMVDRKDICDSFDPRYAANAARWLDRLQRENLFMTSGNTDPKGDRSLQPHEQPDPDMYLRVVEERAGGIVISGAKFETGAPYAHVALVKPTVGNWIDANADFAVAAIVPLNAPGVRMHCRMPLTAGGAAAASGYDHPLSGRFDELDTLMVFDHVFVPWEDVLFCRQPKMAAMMRSEFSRWAAQGYLVRCLSKAELLVGAALLVAQHSGTDKIPPVRSKIAQLMMHKQAIEAFVIGSEAACKPSPGGFTMPDQAIQNAGRIFCSQSYHHMVQLLREIVGGQPVMLPDEAMLDGPETRADIEKFFAGGGFAARERIQAMHLARELTGSAYAGRTQAYQLFAETPVFAQEAALYATYDRDDALRMAMKWAGIGDAEETAGASVPAPVAAMAGR
ncbi:4-hydroxyphenylacetate 3-hydroxylase family protein [Mangrovicoccus sp. HB161399]|uniref:4-hydroxyphenylacetate 3-hydroxylase family protein n=1 Tax=Mangrovicoccus sp. HB161399 TaxID=2720392 RepID=UPI001551E8DB|nr:4-hydroxyphenylacetate 3-hydroxylase N-terminal domain-containing protein [Mangrovicoccus sp. HB161399]